MDQRRGGDMAANDYKMAIRHYRKQNRIFAFCAFSGAAMMIAAFLQPRVGEHLSQVNLVLDGDYSKLCLAYLRPNDRSTQQQTHTNSCQLGKPGSRGELILKRALLVVGS